MSKRDASLQPVMMPADLMSMLWITHHLREVDKREVFAGRFSNGDDLAIDVVRVPGFVDVCWLGDKPAAAIGGRELWPGVWSVWAFGTDEWPRVKYTLTRHVVQHLVPAMLRQGGRRATCESHASHVEAHRWLEWLGFEREAVLRGHGRDGSDFYLYAWLRSDDHVRWWGRRDRQFRTDVSAEPGPAGPG